MVSHTERLGTLGKLLGIIVFFGVLWAPAPLGMPAAAQRLAAVVGLMVALWMTQAIPLGITSLIPLVLFPFMGIQTAADVSNAYIDKNIFLFLGGFIIALGIEKWGLHRRIALHIVKIIGSGPRRLVLGFMLATAFLSMWISNTASTLLMMPIGLAMISSYQEKSTDEDSERFLDQLAIVLMLGIAYSASIGGMSTLVGTPTNVVFNGIWTEQFPRAPQLSAGQWMSTWVPVGGVFLLIAWGVLAGRLQPPPSLPSLSRDFVGQRLSEMGPPRWAEIAMAIIFTSTAFLWSFRTPLRFGDEPLIMGWQSWLEPFFLRLGTDVEFARTALHDSTVAIGMAVLMFFIPAERPASSGKRQYLMDWSTVQRLPWEILLLIGGGFAIAGAFRETRLSEWTGDVLVQGGIENLPLWVVVLIVCLMMTFLTEFTSNVATVNTVLPVLAGAAVRLGIDPRLVMIPAAISASCAFMLPIATPPNAIVFGSGRIPIAEMMRRGVILNFIGVVLITLSAFVLLSPQLGIGAALPEWATR